MVYERRPSFSHIFLAIYSPIPVDLLLVLPFSPVKDLSKTCFMSVSLIPIPLWKEKNFMESILKVENIEKYYGSRSSLTKAIDNLSLEVEKGFLQMW